MQLRMATEGDVPHLATLMAGSESQLTTAAGMRLFALESINDVIEVNRVMMSSTNA